MKKKVQTSDSLMATLKQGILDVLNDPSTPPAERLKAVEAGAKLLMIENKIKLSSEGKDGNFFG